jgi:hypothetical protein
VEPYLLVHLIRDVVDHLFVFIIRRLTRLLLFYFVTTLVSLYDALAETVVAETLANLESGDEALLGVEEGLVRAHY